MKEITLEQMHGYVYGFISQHGHQLGLKSSLMACI